MNEYPAFLVFMGTLTMIVRAPDEDAAFDAFLAATAPNPRLSGFGRYVPPIRDEVKIRRPSESDRDWILESGDPAFLLLLPELVSR